MIHFLKIIEQHSKNIETINRQCRFWVLASFILFTCVIVSLFGWDWFVASHQKVIKGSIIASILLTIINWWYWTMKIIFDLFKHQQSEYKLLLEVLKEVQEAKQVIKEIEENCECNDK
jgi:hypothetical protein